MAMSIIAARSWLASSIGFALLKVDPGNVILLIPEVEKCIMLGHNNGMPPPRRVSRNKCVAIPKPMHTANCFFPGSLAIENSM